MSFDPMTTDQGEEIIRLLEKILQRLEDIKDNTSPLSDIACDLDRIEKNVLEITART